MQTRHDYDLCEGCRGLDDAEANGPYEEIGPFMKVCHHPCVLDAEHAAHTALAWSEILAWVALLRVQNGES